MEKSAEKKEEAVIEEQVAKNDGTVTETAPVEEPKEEPKKEEVKEPETKTEEETKKADAPEGSVENQAELPTKENGGKVEKPEIEGTPDKTEEVEEGDPAPKADIEKPTAPAEKFETTELQKLLADMKYEFVKSQETFREAILELKKMASAEEAADKAKETKEEEAPKEEVAKADTSSEEAIQQGKLLSAIEEIKQRLEKVESFPAPSKVVVFEKGIEKAEEPDDLEKIEEKLAKMQELAKKDPVTYMNAGHADEALRLVQKKKQLLQAQKKA